MALLRRLAAPKTPSGVRDTERTGRPAHMPRRRDPRGAVLAAISRFARGIRTTTMRFRKAPAEAVVDPTLPAAAQIVQVQHPSATLPARPYDLLLLAAVLGLLTVGTIEIY